MWILSMPKSLIYLLLFNVTIISTVSAQEIDSLKLVLTTDLADTTRVDVLNRLALLHYNIDGRSTLQYADRAKRLATERSYIHGITEAYKMRGVGYWILGKTDSAISAYSHGLELAKQYGNQKGVATFYNNLSLVYSDRANYHQALSMLFKGLDYINDDRLKAHFYQNIGSTYIDLKAYDEAREYTSLALDLFRRLDNADGVATCYNNLGEIHLALGDLSLAQNYLTEARIMFSDLDNQRGISITTRNLGKILQLQNDISGALMEYRRAEKLFRGQQNVPELAFTLNELARLSMLAGDLAACKRYLDEAHRLVEEGNLKDRQKDVLLSLSDYYKAKGESGSALSYLSRHLQLKDSLFTLDKNRQVVELKAMYDDQKRENELLLLREEQEQSNARLAEQEARERLLIAVIAFIVIIVVVLIWVIYNRYAMTRNLTQLNMLLQNKNAEIQAKAGELNEAYEEIKTINANLEQIVATRTDKLDKSNAELAEFLYRASHDLRGPLMTLKGLSYVGLKDESAAFDDIMKKIGETSDNMNATLNNLLNINVVRKEELIYLPIDLDRMTESIKDACRDRTDHRVTIYTEVEEGLLFESDPELILIILHNLICNALQYHDADKADPHIVVRLWSQAEGVLLSVKDNGIGISQEQLEKIFKMFYRGNVRSHGNGLGLYIVKVAVENLGGRIEIQSEVGKGTEVKMLF